ncbi:MsnO8 family LLM class oxidoreductase [Chitinophaga silvisoli]|uniref:MsnO8 family LLM class oxidoreductase n=1 Tax=Chitinophaga silvisoli TaxID=2291814 RepID=A0A3E1NXK3_9BACT|nr:MsnO8 family LLM class oxidoreductase [Chitinophaga silvisoli]RFM32667.1 MsnO8 family LLM class oxidoreductase [Chitinophaga silvisoli]
MKLSLVDLSTTPYQGDRKQALKDTIETAKVIEELGFQRIWLAEHHSHKLVAGRSPEVLIAAVAENTRHIHVGAGGVLLNHYSPFKVAETFATLSELYSGRIDLGIGRATTGKQTDLALQRNRSVFQYPDDSMDQLTELLCWLSNGFPSDHPFNQVKVYNDGALPNVYLLGSSGWSAEAAARMGLAYSFAGFFNPQGAFSITQQYMQHFRSTDKSYGHKEPKLILGLAVFAQETDHLAIEFSAPMQYFYKQARTKGILGDTLLSEKDAIKALEGSTLMERLVNPVDLPQFIVGKAETVAQELKIIKSAFGAEEIMIRMMTSDHTSKLKSLELLTKCFQD